MLDQSRPSFLDMLDDKPEEAFAAFYSFARAILNVRPPRPMQSMSGSELEDMAQDIILHCVKDDFRVLRNYKDRGKPFAAWFYVMAHNKSMDYLRKKRRDADLMSDLAVHQNNPVRVNPANSGAGRSVDPEQRRRMLAVLEAVNECMSTLGQYCELLLSLAADEYKPSEMVLALGWPRDQNKKVADDLRECRRRLRRILADRGIDMEAAMPD